MNTLDVLRPSPFVAEVWLNRPELRNAFNEAMVEELTRCFRALAREPDLRAIVLAGRGKAFCAGADLSWMRAMADYTWAQNHADASALAEMLHTLWSCPLPLVGRIQGDCYAGGLGLAAVCDVVVAAEPAQFCLSEVRLGLLPATISPYVVRALGDKATRRYALTAERFAAAQAQALGLVQACVAPEALDATVADIVQALVANGPAAVRACKQLLRDVTGRPLDAALRDDTARRIADVRASEEGREGVRAFLAKREPDWRPPPSTTPD